MLPLEDILLLPIVFGLNYVFGTLHIAFDRFLVLDFCHELSATDCSSAEVSAAAASWLRWLVVGQIIAGNLSLLPLGAISDWMRTRNPSRKFARAPLLCLQLSAIAVRVLVITLQIWLRLPRWLQLASNIFAGFLGGEGNAAVAGFYTVRGDAFDASTSDAERANAFLRLQLTLQLGRGFASFINALLVANETRDAYVQALALCVVVAFANAAACGALILVDQPEQPQDSARIAARRTSVHVSYDDDWNGTQQQLSATSSVHGKQSSTAMPSASELVDKLKLLHIIIRLRPIAAAIVAALYVNINVTSGMDAIMMIYLSNLGYGTAASARIDGFGRLAAAAYLLIAPGLVRLLDAPKTLSLFALLTAFGFALLAVGSSSGLDALVVTGITLHTARMICLALTRAMVAQLVPSERLGTAFFALAILDQLASLVGDFGLATLLAATAASWPSFIAWLCVLPSAHCVLLGLQLADEIPKELL